MCQPNTRFSVHFAEAFSLALKLHRDQTRKRAEDERDSAGILATNHHVVEGCREIQAKLKNGDEYTIVGVYAIDPAKDLVLLRIPGFGLPTLSLGDSDSVRKGDRLLVLGDPLGLEGTVSEGVLSAIRQLEGHRVFQMDAAVSSGSSGGPVLNGDGDAVAVTTFKLEQGESLNFAVPINYIRGLLAVDRGLGSAPWTSYCLPLGTAPDSIRPSPTP